MTPIAAPEPERSPLPARIAAGASIAVHIAAVVISLGYAGAGAFESAPEAVPVSLVTPQDVPATPEPKPEPEVKLDLRPTQSVAPSAPPSSSQPQPPAQPQAQSKTQPKAQANTQANAQAKASPQPAPDAPPAAEASPAAAQPAYTPPQPDLALQYGVDFGLKPMPMVTAAAAAPKDGRSDFDDAATAKADVDRSSIAAFRAHLKQCAALPAQIAPDDKVVIVLRAMFTPDAKLAAEPVLIEASASPSKGIAMRDAAIAALQACQPYGDLPADRYAEWKILDLRFTPQDFRG